MNDYFDDFIHEIRRRIREIENELEQMFSLTTYPKDDLDEEAIEPLATLSETPDMVVVSFDMPFVDQNSIEAKLLDNRHLMVKARIRKTIHSSKIDLTYPEMEFKNYKCILKLPSRVKKIMRLSVRRDVLTIYLMKESISTDW